MKQSSKIPPPSRQSSQFWSRDRNSPSLNPFRLYDLKKKVEIGTLLQHSGLIIQPPPLTIVWILSHFFAEFFRLCYVLGVSWQSHAQRQRRWHYLHMEYQELGVSDHSQGTQVTSPTVPNVVVVVCVIFCFVLHVVLLAQVWAMRAHIIGIFAECLLSFCFFVLCRKGVNDLAVHPSGKLALSVGKDKVFKMWDLVKGKSAFKTRLNKGDNIVFALP